MAAFTGPAAQLGIQFHEGARVYFDQLNAQGGIARQQIELRKLDDGYEPARCAENTQKFIADDVFSLFGHIGTPTSLVALPMAIKEKIPFTAPFTGAMALREPFSRCAFHVRASYNDETALVVKQLTNPGLKQIAVFHQNDAYGKAGLDCVNSALGRLALKPVVQVTMERNSVDVAQAVKTLVAARPDAVVQIGAYKACAAFIREPRKSGYGGIFYNVPFVGTQALADELGKEGAGVVVSQVMPSPYNPARAIAREFIDAVKAVGRKEVQANFSSMEGIGSQSFGGFAVSFGPGDHVASSFVELSMLTGDGRVRT